MSIVPSNRKIPAGIIAIFLGFLGMHKFFLGLNRAGATMLLIYFGGLALGCAGLGIGYWAASAMGLIGFVEGIIYLVRSDRDFYNTYIVRRQEWF